MKAETEMERVIAERDLYEVDSAGLRAVCQALLERFPAAETMTASEAVHALADRLERAEAAAREGWKL